MPPPNQSINSATFTLPRNHLVNNNSSNTNQYHESQNDSSQNSSYRTRSMSQEVLKASEEQQITVPSPLKPTLRQVSVTSPTPQFNPNLQHHQQYQHQPRGLPNEQQIRYGSERPAMLQNQTPMIQQRNGLPNELIPRFGSERPSSSQTQQHHNHNHHHHQQQQQQRFNGQQPVNGHDLSPIKTTNRARQASLSELDEINYNQQMQQQQQFEDLYGKVRPNIETTPNLSLNGTVSPQLYKTLPNNNSRNGNVNNLSLNNANHHQNVLLNGNAQNSIDEQRTKSQSQLYEQIWAANNNNQNQNQQRLIQQQQFNKQNHFAASVDDLNLKNLEIRNGHAHVYHASQQQQHLLQKNGHNHHPQINSQSHSNINQHLRKFDFIDNTTNTNGIAANSQLATASSHPNLNPNQINKVSRSNLANTNGSQSGRSIPVTIHHHHHQHQQYQQRQVQENGINNDFASRNYENQVINTTAPPPQVKPMPPPVLAKPVIPNKPFNIQINQNRAPKQSESERLEEEQFRLLKQRLDMLQQLEQKSQRSAEEESRLNKLRTEIEFDRRVLEMNSVSSQYLDETNDDNDIDYSPEVRERLSNQMKDDLLERRRLFEQCQSESKEQKNQKDEEEKQMRQNEIEQAAVAAREMEEYKKRRDDEQAQERMAEMKREEMRLKKHIDLNLRGSSTNLGSYHFTQQKTLLNGSCSPEPSEMYLQSNGGGLHRNNNGSYSNTEIELVESTSCSNLLNVGNNRPQKHVQFVSEAEIMSPKMSQQRFGSNGNSPEHSNEGSNGSTPPPPPPPPMIMPTYVVSTTPTKRVMFSDLDFENGHGHGNNANQGPQTPSVIGANEVYVDQRLKMKQKQQEQQQLASMYMEGEKLSFKDKMKLFAKQSGELINDQADVKYKVSRKQREIESKFESK